MRILAFISLFWVVGTLTAGHHDVRKAYPEATSDPAVLAELIQQLENDSYEKDAVDKGYLGACHAVMAQYTEGREEKLELFKKGKALLESAIAESPENVELRYLRLSVQENAPKVLRYRGNIEEDKTVISKSYSTISEDELKQIIRGFILRSTSFSEEEKLSLAE